MGTDHHSTERRSVEHPFIGEGQLQVTFGRRDNKAHIERFVDDTHQTEPADEQQKGLELPIADQLQRFIVAV